jgi:L-methionine (R)-S-oxide reductase
MQTFPRKTRLTPQLTAGWHKWRQRDEIGSAGQLERKVKSPSRNNLAGLEPHALYAQVHKELAALLEDERDLIANSANCAGLLFHALPDLNWAGFYFLKGSELVLGPFQGQPACVRIGMGRGVCGTAALEGRTIIVANVHEFPGHIACDSASESEIVVPLRKHGKIMGVLDLDSPRLGRFDAVDAEGLETIAKELVAASDV